MPCALISVSDKTGLTAFVQDLKQQGWDIIASGGTAAALEQAGLEIIQVSAVTGMEELLGGRVKTLHPAIHAGILARANAADRQTLQSMQWPVIDMVVVNLYPFTETVAQSDANHAEIIENIDIGGVALLRAAAKNFARVLPICDPADYVRVLENLDQPAFYARMAQKAFTHTSAYDQAIAGYLSKSHTGNASEQIRCYPELTLRYGENPHQTAQFLALEPGGTPFGAQVLQGKTLSYNNLLDLDGALFALAAFSEPTVVIVKHSAPCGIASASNPADAFSHALASDPVSAFGSVIVCNRAVDMEFARRMDLFVECLLAPAFSAQVRAHFEQRPNLRLLQVDPAILTLTEEIRSIPGGFIRQQRDKFTSADLENWQDVTECKPDSKQRQELAFAWKACLAVKSNAVLLAGSQDNSFFTVGIGGGQPNRVDSVRIAAQRAADRAPGSVLASDAFFPFADGIEAAAAAGVTAIIQPGGSMRDHESIAAANQLGISMVFTGRRHFRH